VLDRELGAIGDQLLLCLERMRLLDMAHSWSLSTHQQYQGKLSHTRRFESSHPGLNVLCSTPTVQPSNGVEIPLMWAEEEYSLRENQATQNKRDFSGRVSYGTIRQLRSAVSQYYTVNLLNTHSGRGAQRATLPEPTHAIASARNGVHASSCW
jgi:hypothetical protein